MVDDAVSCTRIAQETEPLVRERHRTTAAAAAPTRVAVHCVQRTLNLPADGGGLCTARADKLIGTGHAGAIRGVGRDAGLSGHGAQADKQQQRQRDP
jgi:hypothetical protein